MLIAVVTLFTACEEYNDQFEGLDDKVHEAYIDVTTITLADADYSTISSEASNDAVTEDEIADAKSVGSNKYFSEDVLSVSYIPYLLNVELNSFDEGAACIVTYNFNVENIYLSNISSPVEYTLVVADYDAMGETGPGEHDNFSSSLNPDDYLPAFLDTKYTTVTEGDVYKITYDYYTGTTTVRYSYYYVKDGSFSAMPTSYELTDDDYDAMGDATGTYNNFSSSAEPEDYLPTFLGLNHPYAKAGDVFLIIYKYYSGGTQTRGSEYVFDGTAWAELKSVSEKTEQYIFNGKTWTFDPSVAFTLESSDYEIMVTHVQNDAGLNQYMDKAYDNSEYYFGASYYYNNLNFQLYKRQEYDADNFPSDISEADALVIMNERAVEGVEVVLKAKYPDAVPNVNGADVYFTVTYNVYFGGGVYEDHTVKFQCTAVGEFTLVEGPTVE